MRLIVVALTLLLAGCSNSPNGPPPADDPEPLLAPPPTSLARTLDECPDMALVMQVPLDELQAELPDGYVAAEDIDFYLGLSPLDVQTETGLTGTGALVVFVQACDDGFQEGYTAIFIRAPDATADLPETPLNFYALQHGMNATWLTEFGAAHAWNFDEATSTVDHTLSSTGRRGSVSWSDSSGLVASVDGTGLPGHPPLSYDARIRIVAPLANGTLAYDHLAAGNMYPAVNFRCQLGDDTEAARIAGQTNCQNGPDRQFQAFILEGHDPTLEFTILPA